jgi:hypothetical protein
MRSISIPSRRDCGGQALPVRAAAELLVYAAGFLAGTLAYATHLVSENGAAALTLLLLTLLSISAWRRFDGGRHPCFLVLCMLIVFCGGRIVGHCLGVLEDPLRVDLMTPLPFDLAPEQNGTVLACLCLSALCIYGPCSLRYQRTAPLDVKETSRYLPYLYTAFVLLLPVQALRNLQYYLYLRDHGYLAFFIDHQGLTAQIPLVLRVASTFLLPVFLAIFVFETRKALVWLVTCVYFGSALLILLAGSRGAVFALALALWYVAKRKSAARSRILIMVAATLLVMAAASLIGSSRDTPGMSSSIASPAKFMVGQGATLGVLEACVAYRSQFSPFAWSYLTHELESAFVASDQAHYVRGIRFSDDMAVFLNPGAYNQGFGSGSAYLAESYALGGLWGVAAISVLIGFGLHLLHLASRSPRLLVVVALLLPEVLWMVRGGLLEWLSMLVRSCLLLSILGAGWIPYSILVRLAAARRAEASAGQSSTQIEGAHT